MPTLTTSPWDKVVERLAGKTPAASALRSADWALVPLALREKALFSAGVESARTLSAIQEKILAGLTQARPGGTGMDRGRFVAELRALLGAAPGDSGDLTDLTSSRRLELIWDFQVADAHGHAAHQAALDPNLLDAYPAYRLVRIEARLKARDWAPRWAEAGKSVGWQGASRTAFVALKTSPIWAALSRFERPWPPFDYGSGMGRVDVDRDEAEALGLLKAGQPPAERLRELGKGVEESKKKWADDLQGSTKGISETAREWLADAFGDQIRLEGDTARWVRAPGAVPAVPTASPATPPPPATPAAKPVPVLPDPVKLTAAAAKAATREEAHAAVALPAAERGALAVKPTKAAAKQTKEATDFISSVLHKDAAPTAPVKVHVRKGRASYDPATKTVRVRAGDTAVTVHEIAHHIERSDPRILAQCRAFLQSRAKPGEAPQSLRKLTGNNGYRLDEMAIEDEWAAKGGRVYTGKVMKNATEVLTMGMQRLYTDPVGFAKQDPDFFRFILSVLRPSTP